MAETIGTMPTIGMQLDAMIAHVDQLPSTQLYGLIVAATVGLCVVLLGTGNSNLEIQQRQQQQQQQQQQQHVTCTTKIRSGFLFFLLSPTSSTSCTPKEIDRHKQELSSFFAGRPSRKAFHCRVCLLWVPDGRFGPAPHPFVFKTKRGVPASTADTEESPSSTTATTTDPGRGGASPPPPASRS